jgi:addiction module HigA family antidote
MLEEEFLKPLGLTISKLVKEISVSPQLLGAMVAGENAITEDIDLRLCEYFGLSYGWWIRGQTKYDKVISKY